QSVNSARYNIDADRIRQHYQLGWEAFRAERWEEAAREFKHVIEIDTKYKLAYYGLGRSYMGLKRLVEAAGAYERCESLYQADAAQKFSNIQEADRIRQSDLDAMRQAVNTLNARSGDKPPSNATQNQIRTLREQMQQIQVKRDIMNND